MRIPLAAVLRNTADLGIVQRMLRRAGIPLFVVATLVIAQMGEGCVSPSTVTCNGGWICPANTRCGGDANHRCVTAAEDAACADLKDDDICFLAGAPGTCVEGACQSRPLDWEQQPPVSTPVPRSGHAMAALGDKVFLFGGVFDYGPVDDTWAWDGRAWTGVGGKTSPAPRANHAMATLGEKVVLFGGDAVQSPNLTGPSYGDTWEWDGISWSERAPPTSPPARTNHAMATLGNKVVLFGGTPTGVPFASSPPANLPVLVSESDTWEWDGATWTKVAPLTRPPARMNHAMATLGNKVVLFGGEGANGPTDDTWAWDGTTWTELAPPTSPPARMNHAMVTRGDRIVLAGGESDGVAMGDTWEWDGATWTQVGAGSRRVADLAMASRSGEILAFGGYEISGPIGGKGGTSGVAGAGGPPPGTGGIGGAGGGQPPPVACAGTPPASPLITDFSDAVAGDPILFGAPPNVSGVTFSYAAPGLTRSVLSVVTGANGTPALHVDANPGAPTDPSNGWFGFGLAFDGCVDARAFNAVRFTINGSLGSCSIRFAVTSSENVSPTDDPRGTCTDATCYPPSTPITTTGTMEVPFFGAAFSGNPNIVDPNSFVGIQWQMDTPSGTGCTATFTIDDITFVNAPAPTGAGGSGGAAGTTGGKAGSSGGAGAAGGGRGGGVKSWTAGTWEWNGEVWGERLFLNLWSFETGSIAMSGGRPVLFSGTVGTWEWDGVVWRALALSEGTRLYLRTGQAMASLGDKIVLFGGTTGNSMAGPPPGSSGPCNSGPLADTWEWDGARWTLRAPTASPPARADHAMATLGQKVVLYGGTSVCSSSAGSPPAQPTFDDTWEWDGANWTPSPAAGPPARWGHAMVTVGDRVILFGGQGADGPLNDTWAWDGVTWTLLPETSAPPARSGHALATLNNSVVMFGGRAENNTLLHDTWVFTRDRWTQLTPFTYPDARAGHVMAGVAGELMLMGPYDMWWLRSSSP